MEKQNRVNEEKNRNRQRQETEVVTERESKKWSNKEDGNTWKDCHQTKTCGGKRHSIKKGRKKND